MNSFSKNLLFFFLTIGLLFIASNSSLADESEGKNNGLRLVAKTELYPASTYLYGEEETEEAKERTKLGIGETVTIYLEGKEELKKKYEKIRWEIEEKGKALVEEPKNLEGVTYIKLTVRKDLKKADIEKAGGGFTVKVAETEKGILPESIKFEVVFPDRLTAEHHNGGTIVDGYPGEDSPYEGASAQMQITIHPLDVNFSKISVKERDGGDPANKGLRPPSNADAPGSLAITHGADSQSKINTKNQFISRDQVGYKVEGTVSLYNTTPQGEYIYKFPQSWTWDCDFKTVEGDELVQAVEQSFGIGFSTPEKEDRESLLTKVYKFTFLCTEDKNDTRSGRCGVERISYGRNIFKPEKPKPEESEKPK